MPSKSGKWKRVNLQENLEAMRMLQTGILASAVMRTLGVFFSIHRKAEE